VLNCEGSGMAHLLLRLADQLCAPRHGQKTSNRWSHSWSRWWSLTRA